MTVMSLSPLSEVVVVHSVGKSFSTDSNSLKHSVTFELRHYQVSINQAYVRQKKKKRKSTSPGGNPIK